MPKRTIGISAISFDPVGNKTLYLDPMSRLNLNRGTRRATRTPTLDGAAVVYDAGYSASDRTFEIAVRASNNLTINFFARMVQIYNLIRISTDEGVFKAVPSRWYEANGLAWLETLVTEKESY